MFKRKRKKRKQIEAISNKKCAITMQDYAPSPAVLLQLTPSEWKNIQDKRNWNRMQGMWGKRSQQSDESALSQMTPPRVSFKTAVVQFSCPKNSLSLDHN
jgi:hypothetical protein